MQSNWTIDTARQLYSVPHWSNRYFDINEAGHVVMQLPDQPNKQVDLHQLVKQVQDEGMHLPLLIRFVDILHDRVQKIQHAFNHAIQHTGHQSSYTAVYPIKVNQQRSVVENILATNDQIGLEAGSKPELMAVLGTAKVGSTIICNGYKDREYLRLALIGRQMGHRIFIVIEKPSELWETLEEAEKLEIEPLLGIRVRLSSIGNGKWQDTGGDKSKFGLTAAQALHAIEHLRTTEQLHTLQLLHFHMGSQIANIRDIQRGMREASRYFAELYQLGAHINTVDVGGGLGVDYEGSRSRNDCSINYTTQEYANTIVRSLSDSCETYNIPFPHLITEAGRAMTAHHAVLITNVIDTEPEQPEPVFQEPIKPDEDAPLILQNLYRVYSDIEHIPASETYHDAGYWLSEAHGLYAHGMINLAQRAQAEQLHYVICQKLMLHVEHLKPELKASLEDKLANKYFCNFSLFQSMPDVWAIDQIFPIMPLHRLNECPDRRVSIQDMTCDSDGRIERYVEGGDLKSTLPLHSIDWSENYYIGMFMVGAYQEILGDLHNLFGDTDSINIKLLDNGEYQLREPERGDTIDELLRYVHFEPKHLLAQCRRKLAMAVTDIERQKMLLREIEAGLIAYTYLED